jgi:xanthine/uracil permease
VAAIALEPAPSDPDATAPLVVELASLGFLAALLVTAVAAGLHHRAAAVAGVVAGVLLATFTVACPVSGHHQVGLWWFGQLALVTGMLGVSLVALGDRARQPA